MMTHTQYMLKQRGVGLVELMIALLVGLFLVGGVLTMFTNSKRTYLYQQAQGVEGEYQRLAATVFGVMLRQAGHSEMNSESLMGRTHVFNNNTVAPFKTTTTPAVTVVNGQIIIGSGDNSGNDSISYRFRGGIGIVACDGGNWDDPDLLRQETLKIVNGILECSWGSTTSEKIALVGDVNVSAAQQLRVESLNVSYGLDSTGDESIDRYYSADLLNANAAVNWTMVRSAIIELETRSGSRKTVTMKYAVELPNAIGALI